VVGCAHSGLRKMLKRVENSNESDNALTGSESVGKFAADVDDHLWGAPLMGRMKQARVPVWLSVPLLVGALAGRGEALDPAEFMPVEEIRAGQTGVGLSVFQGTTPDSFEIDILGVLESVGPGRDLILGKARGAFLENTGIIAGMSGSPVYVEGRLIGAAAYAWTFAKEPIVGITPIGEMMAVVERSEASLDLGMEGDLQEGFFSARHSYPTSAAPDLPGPVSEVRPIQTPVVLAGVPGSARAAWQDFLAPFGFVGVEGGGTAPAIGNPELRPGSAMGIQMVRGDFSSTAIGTVTWVDGETMLGFGHPFLMAGPVSLPLSSVYVHTVFPSVVASFKIGSPGPPVGAIRQDRQAGVMGIVGADVPMLPVSVSITSAADDFAREYHFEVMRSEILTSSLVGLVGYSSLEAAQKTVGESTLDIRTEIRMEPDRVLDTRIAVASPSPPLAVAEQIGMPLQYLIENPYEKIKIREIRVQVEIIDRFRVAAVEDLRVSRAEVRPGDDLDVWVTLRPYRESEVIERVKVHIPSDAPPGVVDLVACSSADLWALEAERAPLRFEPQSVDQMIDLLGSRRDTRKIYLQLFQHKQGRVVGGEEMPRLPGSVLSVMTTGVRAGRTGSSEGAALIEDEVETPWVVVGSRSIRVEIVSR